MSNETSRKAFEAWANDRGMDASAWGDYPDVFKFKSTNDAWDGWQASRKALEAEQMKPDDENSVEYWKAYSKSQDHSYDLLRRELKKLRAAQTVEPTVTQPASTERAELLAELRCRFVGDPFPLMDKAADMLEADAQQFTVPAGYVLVPLEPTPEMSAAGFCVTDAEHDPAGVYAAMLKAAPQPPQGDAT